MALERRLADENARATFPRWFDLKKCMRSSDGATQIVIDRRPGPLRMIRLFPQQSVEKWLSRRLFASAVRLDGHKDCINFSQLPWVVQAKHPPAIGFTIHVQNAKVHRMRFPI